MNSRTLAIATLFQLLVFCSLLQAKFVRIGVLDLSSSMSGQRLPVVVDELRQLASQRPPSVEDPFVLILFNDKATDPRVFTNPESFDELLSKLSARGGTNIAAGLESAYRALADFVDEDYLVVLLYTDGEDGNLDGISVQERKLNQLFKVRMEKGLQKTVVFCKRWGNANDVLVRNFKEQGSCTLIDAKELTMRPLTLRPQIQVNSVAWDIDDSETAQVEVETTLKVEGAAPDGGVQLQAQCTTPNVDGTTNLLIDSTRSHLSALRCRISREHIAKGSTTLQFQVDSPIIAPTAGSIFLPIIPESVLEIPVLLPERKYRTLITVLSKQEKSASWVDPVKLEARFPLSLEFTSTLLHANAPIDGETTFEIIGESGTHLIGDRYRFMLGEDMTRTVNVVALSSSFQSSSQSSLVRLLVRVVTAPPNVVVEPSSLAINLELARPSPVLTRIEGRIQRVDKAQWVDFKRGLALIECTAAIDVRGPMPAETRLTVTPPLSVNRMDVKPDTLRSGTQQIKLRFTSRLQRAPKTSLLTFGLEPPRSTPAITFSVASGLESRVVAPKPAQLLLTNGKSPFLILEARVSDLHHRAIFPVVPMIADGNPKQVGTLKAKCVARTEESAEESGPLPLNMQGGIVVRLDRKEKLPFFTDGVITGVVNVDPETPSPAIEGSQIPFSIVSLAPFRRWLVYFSVTFGACGAAYLLIHLYTRMRAVP